MINNILYTIGGERASGAEIVMERLILNNDVNSHIFISPGSFSSSLVEARKPYVINVVSALKKLNRRSSSTLGFVFRAVRNYFLIPYLVLKYVKKHKIDVVHCNTIGQAAYLLPLLLLRPILCPKVKCVWTDHDLKYFFFLDNGLSKICSKLYDITFVVSEAVKRKYEPSEKIIVLYNGLNGNVFKPDNATREINRNQLQFKPTDVVIGHAGVMSRRKGQLGLIEAFNKLRLNNSNVNLLLAGRFDVDELEYNDLVNEAFNSPGIIYLGELDDMAGFYNTCDIIVSNSDLTGSEPLGTTIYEAMACKKIVVASDTGGTKEIIDDDINGFLFEAESVNSLLNKLTNVIENFKDQDEIREAARKKVEKVFDIHQMSKAYKNYLTTI